ncbi:MAG: GPGG-motif small membrane protein [Actinomycetota bacterium]
MGFVLWILAVILAIFGIVRLFGGDIIWGIVLLVLAAGVGPGGWSFFRRRS